MQSPLDLLHLGGGESSAVTTRPLVHQSFHTFSSVAPAPTHQACPAAPGYVHHVLGRVARTVQPNRQVAAARGAVFALVVNPLKSIFLFLRKLKLSRNHASIVQRLINFCIRIAEETLVRRVSGARDAPNAVSGRNVQ